MTIGFPPIEDSTGRGPQKSALNPALLAALITQVAIPELTRWLTSLGHAKTPLTDEVILAKLLTDTDLGTRIGEQWLAEHPAP